jgi:DNA-binding transcriptional LysR family regulator
MNWNDIQIFNAVAVAQSIRGAAAALRMSHSTVSRRIQALEKKLATRLFQSMGEGYLLTDAGCSVYSKSQGLDESFHELERRVLGRDQKLQGQIRLTLPEIFVKLLMPQLREFNEQYPDILLIIMPTYDLLNLSKREADVAIRVVSTPPDHLVGRKLGAFAWALYASREYIAQHEPLKESRDLSWVNQSREGLLSNKPVRICIRSGLLTLEAAKAGLGICPLPCFLGDTEPSLRRVLDGSSESENAPFWLLTHPDLRHTARIRLLMRFLGDAIRNHKALLLGQCPAQS